MDGLLKKLKELKRSNINNIISERIEEFKSFKNKDELDFFKELSFCLLTANYNAEKAIIIQNKIDFGFITLSFNELSSKLKELGYRYPNKRAEYIIYNRKFLGLLKKTLFNFKDTSKRREWLVENIKGFGMKEASHFLRNIGFLDVSIIDFHIIDLLVKENLLKDKPKSFTRKRYLEIETLLRDIANLLELELGILDLYLWFIETGKVLK